MSDLQNGSLVQHLLLPGVGIDIKRIAQPALDGLGLGRALIEVDDRQLEQDRRCRSRIERLFKGSRATDVVRMLRERVVREDILGRSAKLEPSPAAERAELERAGVRLHEIGTTNRTHLADYEAALTVGTPVAGRERAEVAGLIGFFVNTLVLRADNGGEGGVLAGAVRAEAAGVAG